MHKQNELHTEKEIKRMLGQEVEIPELVADKIEETLNTIRRDAFSGWDEKPDRKGGKKINPAKRKTGRRKKRHIGAATAAAAVIICTSITAVAAVIVNWNSIVVEEFGIDIELQDELVEQGVAPAVNAGVTDNGVTVSTEQALMDSRYIYLLLKVEAPEDIVLSDSIFFEEFELTLDGQEPDFSYGAGVTDDNPTDNISYWHIWVNNVDSKSDFHDKILGIHLENLTQDAQKADAGTKLIDGQWNLDWNMVYDDAETVFDVNKELPELNMTVKSIALSPISIEVRYDWAKEEVLVDAMDEYGKAIISYDYAEPPEAVGFRMKDGSRREVDTSGPGCMGYMDENSTEYRWSYGMGRVVTVDEVAAVIFLERESGTEIEIALR